MLAAAAMGLVLPPLRQTPHQNGLYRLSLNPLPLNRSTTYSPIGVEIHAD
jgi:hypothetical protein